MGVGIALLLAPSTYAQSPIRTWDSCSVDGVPTLQCLEIVYTNVLFIASGLVGVILFAMVLYGGFLYLTSLGDKAKVTSAQNTIKWAIIGLVFMLASYLILTIIDVLFLGGQGTIFRLNIPGPHDPPTP